MQLPITIICVLIHLSLTQNCPDVTDYTSPTVRCTPVCPSNSFEISDKCLGLNQYISNNEVYLCLNGYVNSDHTLCCRDNKYPILLSNNSYACF